jgi:hypothetical protein
MAKMKLPNGFSGPGMAQIKFKWLVLDLEMIN